MWRHLLSISAPRYVAQARVITRIASIQNNHPSSPNPSTSRVRRLQRVYQPPILPPRGLVWTYLLVEKNPPLSPRMQWALEIAEGLAHLHAKSIVWADAHFRNILITEDLHVVLADFSVSVINLGDRHSFTTGPPPIFAWPSRYFGRTPPTYPDIFGFGVILYSLLMNRFPWMADLLPNLDEQVQASNKHEHKDFDTLEDDDELNKCFGLILEKCFYTQYRDGAEVLDELKKAEALWRLK
ncbi:kinase-like domain-containing protein [Mucidula mucida]|nr:kinase-like domain-containing protein [Mucidula mucida]